MVLEIRITKVKVMGGILSVQGPSNAYLFMEPSHYGEEE